MRNEDDPKLDGAHQGLKALRSLRMEPSPFLVPRVIAELGARENEAKKSPRFSGLFTIFTSVAATTAVLSLILLFGGYLKPISEHPFTVGQVYMIRVDLRSIDLKDVAFAEINLDGDNVEFSSRDFQDVMHDKKLTLNIDSLSGKSYLPVVIRGTHAGNAGMAVSFIDKNHRLVSAKTIALNFKGEAI